MTTPYWIHLVNNREAELLAYANAEFGNYDWSITTALHYSDDVVSVVCTPDVNRRYASQTEHIKIKDFEAWFNTQPQPDWMDLCDDPEPLPEIPDIPNDPAIHPRQFVCDTVDAHKRFIPRDYYLIYVKLGGVWEYDDYAFTQAHADKAGESAVRINSDMCAYKVDKYTFTPNEAKRAEYKAQDHKCRFIEWATEYILEELRAACYDKLFSLHFNDATRKIYEELNWITDAMGTACVWVDATNAHHNAVDRLLWNNSFILDTPYDESLSYGERLARVRSHYLDVQDCAWAMPLIEALATDYETV